MNIPDALVSSLTINGFTFGKKTTDITNITGKFNADNSDSIGHYFTLINTGENQEANKIQIGDKDLYFDHMCFNTSSEEYITIKELVSSSKIRSENFQLLYDNPHHESRRHYHYSCLQINYGYDNTQLAFGYRYVDGIDTDNNNIYEHVICTRITPANGNPTVIYGSDTEPGEDIVSTEKWFLRLIPFPKAGIRYNPPPPLECMTLTIMKDLTILTSVGAPTEGYIFGWWEKGEGDDGKLVVFNNPSDKLKEGEIPEGSKILYAILDS